MPRKVAARATSSHTSHSRSSRSRPSSVRRAPMCFTASTRPLSNGSNANRPKQPNWHFRSSSSSSSCSRLPFDRPGLRRRRRDMPWRPRPRAALDRDRAMAARIVRPFMAPMAPTAMHSIRTRSSGGSAWRPSRDAGARVCCVFVCCVKMRDERAIAGPIIAQYIQWQSS